MFFLMLRCCRDASFLCFGAWWRVIQGDRSTSCTVDSFHFACQTQKKTLLRVICVVFSVSQFPCTVVHDAATQEHRNMFIGS